MSYYYHMDEDGNEWGPFTPGQLTGLLNRGVLNAGSKVRAEDDATWYTYYAVPRKTNDSPPLDPKEAEVKRTKGDEIACALERHIAARHHLTGEQHHPQIRAGPRAHAAVTHHTAQDGRHRIPHRHALLRGVADQKARHPGDILRHQDAGGAG